MHAGRWSSRSRRPGVLSASAEFNTSARHSSVRPLIARRGVAQGSGLGKVRWVVERAFAWLHQFKRLRIRYEPRADLHHGLSELARSLICLRRLRTSI